MPLIDQFGFFAAMFALLAVVHLWWPGMVKNVVDRVADQMGGEAFAPGYDENYYSTVGGIYAFGALAMALSGLATGAML